MISRSRWKCIVAFGSPVVPEVNPRSELGLVIGRAVEADDGGKEPAVAFARDHVLHQPRVAECMADLGLVHDLRQFTRPQHRHGVDHDRSRLGRSQPAGHHGRIVRRADQDAIARPHTVVVNQRIGDAIGPVTQFLVRAAPTVADQRNMVAEALLDHAIGQFDPDIQPFGIFETLKVQDRPGLFGWQSIARKGVRMAGRS
jgi:hypothetical protein